MHAALSEFNRRRSYEHDKEHSHTGHATLDQFEGDDWPSFVKKYFRAWRDFTEQASRLGKEKVCVLIYENLLLDVIKELRPCIEFLGYEVDAELASCIRQDQEGSFHRTPMAEESPESLFSTNFFTAQELDEFHTTGNELTKLLLQNSVNHASQTN